VGRIENAISARKGKTTVLDTAEARQLLDGIDVSTPARLRDRADGVFVRADRCRTCDAG
jgi:uncharacterized LabA/DUF88 family protein